MCSRIDMQTHVTDCSALDNPVTLGFDLLTPGCLHVETGHELGPVNLIWCW